MRTLFQTLRLNLSTPMLFYIRLSKNPSAWKLNPYSTVYPANLSTPAPAVHPHAGVWIHYPPVENAEQGATRAAAHEDINLITLLLSGSKPGLQAKDADGNWHDISCDSGMITINNGDMLAMASNDYYPSTTHRVVNPDVGQNHSRYSMPMFLHPRSEVLLKPGITADEYLQARLKEIGLKPKTG